MTNLENIRKQLGDCCKCLSDEQILLMDSVFRKLAKRLVLKYIASLKENRMNL